MRTVKPGLLFNHSHPTVNLLPYDGIVRYLGIVYPANEANNYYNLLLNNAEWKNDEAIMFGKHIITDRKTAWYADKPFAYTYSKITRQALPWTTELLQIKQKVEGLTQSTYNSCLMNLYHNGKEGMAYHSDDEKELAQRMPIASVTFGAERKFLFKHKRTRETVSLMLEHGSILLMEGDTQINWMHRLPPTAAVHTPRINLTFRLMNA